MKNIYIYISNRLKIEFIIDIKLILSTRATSEDKCNI